MGERKQQGQKKIWIKLEKKTKWGTRDEHNLPVSHWLQGCLCYRNAPITTTTTNHPEDPLCSRGLTTRVWEIISSIELIAAISRSISLLQVVLYISLNYRSWLFLHSVIGCLATAYCQELTLPEKRLYFIIYIGLTELVGDGSYLCGVGGAVHWSITKTTNYVLRGWFWPGCPCLWLPVRFTQWESGQERRAGEGRGQEPPSCPYSQNLTLGSGSCPVTPLQGYSSPLIPINPLPLWPLQD